MNRFSELERAVVADIGIDNCRIEHTVIRYLQSLDNQTPIVGKLYFPYFGMAIEHSVYQLPTIYPLRLDHVSEQNLIFANGFSWPVKRVSLMSYMFTMLFSTEQELLSMKGSL